MYSDVLVHLWGQWIRRLALGQAGSAHPASAAAHGSAARDPAGQRVAQLPSLWRFRPHPLQVPRRACWALLGRRTGGPMGRGGLNALIRHALGNGPPRRRRFFHAASAHPFGRHGRGLFFSPAASARRWAGGDEDSRGPLHGCLSPRWSRHFTEALLGPKGARPNYILPGP